MVAIAGFWRPALAGGLAFGLVFLGHAIAIGVAALGMVQGLCLPTPNGLAWLVLVLPTLAELGKLLALRLAGGAPAWGLLGLVFGLCDALLRLWQPDFVITAAAGTVLLHGALGGLAAAAARHKGVAAGFLLAVLVHALANLTVILAALALTRHQGIPPAEAAGCAGLVLALALSLGLARLAGSYSAATAREADMPKASASSR